MQLVFEVMNGRGKGRQLRVAPGEVRQVGRNPGADLSLPYDSSLGDIHFALQYLDQACRIRPRGNAHTLLNGRPTGIAALQDGDQVQAGETRFLCRLLGAERKGTPRLSQFLWDQPEPAFALLDAARSLEIVELLRNLEPRHRSLFAPDQAEKMASVCPYLVALPQESKLLPILSDLGWGKSWGVFLTSSRPFSEVRRHLQSLLQVEQESFGRLYFRYYDPRVLRVFLPTCTEAEAVEFFGPVTRFVVEDETPGQYLQFMPRPAGVARQPLAVLRG
jgi:predicted component of type VI protein secretion system